MKKTMLTIMFFLVLNQLKSQINETGFGVQLGYTIQNSNIIDLGINHLKVKDFKYTNFGLKKRYDTLNTNKLIYTLKKLTSSGYNASIHLYNNNSNSIWTSSSIDMDFKVTSLIGRSFEKKKDVIYTISNSTCTEF